MTLGLLKIVILACLFLVCFSVFVVFPEADDGAYMHAVSQDHAWSRQLSGGTDAIEATLWVQRGSGDLVVGTEVQLRVLSGEACNYESNCVLTLKVAASLRASIADSFKLSRSGPSTVLVTTNSTVPVAVMVKILELRFGRWCGGVFFACSHSFSKVMLPLRR